MTRDLSRLLHPKSIAVFGGGWAEKVVLECARFGFKGDVWPVHPTREEIGGQRCFRSIRDLHGAPDEAIVGVNRHATLDVLKELNAANCGGSVCFASGFSETGDQDLQQAFISAAGDMPVLGPNCYGLINGLDGAVIWPDEQGCRRVESGVAVISQSSNIAITLTMQRRGLPVAYVACVGNAAQTGLSDLAQAFLDDPRVTALGVYMEGVGDARAFAEVVGQARAAGKGVVVLKAGQSEAGQAAALTHTAALAGEAKASSAYFRQIGAGEVYSIPAMIETLKILHVHGPLKADSFISVSCSGGEAGLAADAVENCGLSFPEVPKAHAERLAEALGPLVTISNPFDYHTFIWGDRPVMEDVFTTALAGFGAGLFIIDPPRDDTCDPSSYTPAFDAIAAATTNTGKPAFAVSTLPDSFDATWSIELMARGVVPLLGLQDALAALQAAKAGGQGQSWRPEPALMADDGTLLDEADSKKNVEQAGVTVPNSAAGSSIEEIDITHISAPLALKGLGFAHKSEVGAVRLGLNDLTGQTPMKGATGYLVEEMVTDSVAEVLIGVRRDPVYGATITVGSGGVSAELLKDTATLIVPATDADVVDALQSLKLWPLLDGYRGRPKADVNSIVDTVLKLQTYLLDEVGIQEIEINPLMVRETGAVAADALVRRKVNV